MKTITKELDFYEILNKMLKAIIKKDITLIKYILFYSTSQNYPSHIHKGLVLEYLIAILINGTSKHAYVNPLVKDEGNDILIFNKNYKLIECIQTKNLAKQLKSVDIDIESSKHSKSQFKNYPFIVISSSGFNISSEKALYYESKNIFIKDFSYIVDLILNFTPTKTTDYLSCYFLKDSNFAKNFKVLVDYNIKNDITAYTKLPKNIASWCTKIRNEYKNGKLDIKKKLLLDKLNFYWVYNDVLWDISFNEVKSIFEKYGSTYTYIKWPTTKAWVKRQIINFIDGNLPNDKFIKLNQIHIIDEWIFNIDLLN